MSDLDFIQAFASLRQTRVESMELLDHLKAGLMSDQLVSKESVNRLINNLDSMLQYQDQCLTRLPEENRYTATLVDLQRINEQLEFADRLAAQADKVRESIRLFTQLVCQDEVASQEFQIQQKKAEQLMEMNDESLVEEGQIYVTIIQILHDPASVDVDLSEVYKQIANSIGFATQYALKNGFLVWLTDDVARPGMDSADETKAETIDENFEVPLVAGEELAPALEATEMVDNAPRQAMDEGEHSDSDTTLMSVDPMELSSIGGDMLSVSMIDFNRIKVEVQDKEKDKNSFSATKFESELKQIVRNGKMPAYVMGYIYNFGLLAMSQASDIAAQARIGGLHGDEAEALLNASVDKLCKKGYLIRVTLTEEDKAEVCYMLSEYGAGVFRKETSRKTVQTLYQHKLVARKGEDDYVKAEPDQMLPSAHRLLTLNQAQSRLERALFRELTVLDTGLEPYPYRRLRYARTDVRYLLFAGKLNATCPAEEMERIRDMLQMYVNEIPFIIVDTAEEGRSWVERLAADGREAYYLLADQDKVLLGDKDGENKFAALFQLEQLTPPDVPSVGETVQVDMPVDESETVKADQTQSIKEPEQSANLNLDDQEHGTATVTYESTTAAAITPAQLAHVVNTALEMVAINRNAEGMILLHSVAGESKEVALLRKKIGFILGDPLLSGEDWHALADTPINLPFRDSEELDDCLNVAMWLRIFYAPDDPNDFRIKNRWRQINNDRSSRALELYPGLKQVIRNFWTFIDRHHVGIKYCASSDARNQLELTQDLNRCRRQIEEILETVFPRNVRVSINHPKIDQMMTELFGNSGALTQLLRKAFDMPLQELRAACLLFADLPNDYDSSDIQPLDNKIEHYIDRHWDTMEFKSSAGKSDALTGALRGRMKSRVREAVSPLLTCYALRCQDEARWGTTEISPELVNASRHKALECMAEAFRQLEQSEHALDDAGVSCLKSVIGQLREALEDHQAESRRPFYESLLLSGEIELDQNGLPIMDSDWLEEHQLRPIEGFRMWERMLRHCNQEPPSWESAAERALREYDLGIYDWMTKWRQQQWHPEKMVADTRNKMKGQLSKYKDDFLADVESSQNYGQMSSNDEMYSYFRLAEAAEKHARATGNAGFFKRLLDACREQIRQGSDANIRAMQKRLEALKRDILESPDRDVNESDDTVLQQWPILIKIEQMLEKRNMTVAEDYIQLMLNGQRDTTFQTSERDMYRYFEEQYQALYTACNAHKGEDLFRTYDPYVRNMLFPNQRNRNTESADKFIRWWFKTQYLGEFMEQLIFDKVERIERIPGKESEFYVYPAARGAKLGQYSHPFAAFGTLAVKFGVRVLRMAGVRTPDAILEEVAQYGAGKGSATIVILDYAMSLAERRQLSKSIKLRAIPEIIAVIDRVMALFLARFSQIERASAFLMTALPSSKVQPYIPVGPIPPEMFIGRADELEQIQNPNGPVFIYGGRQLGKTALLLETKNREHDPENGSFAIFVDLREKGVKDALEKICEELIAEKVLLQPCASWDELRTMLRRRLESSDRPVRKLLLLLDEADTFIAECEKERYRPLELLKELKDLFNHQFRFVLAGLRDVVRFNKQRLGGNSVLAHLRHITIRPLKYLDARDLLLRPMHYLGFRIGEDSEDIINLILAKTNYYPGLIHFYCQKLIEAIADSYRNGTYNERTTPPYVLDEKHIKTLLGQSEFLSEIENKFRITLQLDTDNLYDILANALAYHYYETAIGRGATVQEIIAICQYFEIGKIGAMSVENVRALLEEMVELNIFRHDSGAYVFNRYSFFQMLGNHEQVWEHLYKYSLGEG